MLRHRRTESAEHARSGGDTVAAGHLAVGTEDTITELRVSVRAVLLDTGGRSY